MGSMQDENKLCINWECHEEVLKIARRFMPNTTPSYANVDLAGVPLVRFAQFVAAHAAGYVPAHDVLRRATDVIIKTHLAFLEEQNAELSAALAYAEALNRKLDRRIINMPIDHEERRAK